MVRERIENQILVCSHVLPHRIVVIAMPNAIGINKKGVLLPLICKNHNYEAYR